jgi:hypothetical protein
VLSFLRINISPQTNSIRKVGDAIGYRMRVIFREKEMQRRVFIFKLNRVIAVKGETFVDIDGNSAVGPFAKIFVLFGVSRCSIAMTK